MTDVTVTKTVVCAILSEMVYIKELLLLIKTGSPYSGGAGFFFDFLSGPLPYVMPNNYQNVLSVLLNETFFILFSQLI